MITVIFQHNPLDVSDNVVVEMEGGLTVNELLKTIFTPSFKDFNCPTICQINGGYVLREVWSTTIINQGDTITFSSLVQDPVTAFYVVVAVIAVGSAIYAYSNMPKPTETNIPGADPTYSILGHRNQNKLGQPIEVCYGKNFIYGAFAAKSYNVYKSNDQYLYSLICLGQGEFQVDGVFIEDTPLDIFPDTTYEIYGPGESVTLFPDNVVNSIEVSEIELPGLNEADGGVEVGPYVANAAQTLITRIEIDYSFPQGLYKANNKGGLDTLTVKAEFEYQQIDNNGVPIGDWELFLGIEKTLATTTPKRYTEGVDVPEGRYQIRAMRTTNKDNDHSSGNTLVWQTLRVFMPNVQDYGNVTLIAIQAKASNNLNSSSQAAIRVSATRKLPVYNTVSNTWSEPVATRSAVWALCDLFRAHYGAKLSDKYLALDSLTQLDSLLASRGDTFDWIFDTKMTIWEAAKKICRAVRAVPRLPGSRVNMIRDNPQTIPKGVFTLDNIVAKSFTWDVQFFEINEADSLRVEYSDLATGQIETVLCRLPGGTADNVEEIRLEGVKQRSQAYREGMYTLASKYYLREGVSFSTGLEGYVPSFGDIISVSYDIPLWGSSGFIESVVKESEGVYRITTDYEQDISEGGNYFVNFRKADGSANGPFLCSNFEGRSFTISSSTPPVTVRHNTELPMFQFGLGDNWARICRVTEINPTTGENVAIKAVVYKPVIHTFDSLPTPDYGNDGVLPEIPALPVVTGLLVNALPNETSRVQITWTPAIGASSYVIEISPNGEDWSLLLSTSSTVITTEVLFETLYVRVAGINVGQGPWAIWNGTVGSQNEAPTDVINLRLVGASTGKQFTLSWDQIINANYYQVTVKRKSDGTVLRQINNTALGYTYTSEDARVDAANAREFTFEVVAVNAVGSSENPATLDVSNPAPEKITGVSDSYIGVDRVEATYDLTWTGVDQPDLVAYRIWQGYNSGFIPLVGYHNYEVSSPYLRLRVRMTGEFEPPPGDQGDSYAYTDDTYYLIAAYDVWTDEMLFSEEHHIESVQGPY